MVEKTKNLRMRGAVVAGCTVVALAHHAVFWDWICVYAATVFAFAEHLAEGDGLVPRAGGERVEGFASPTWVGVLAVAHALGVDLHEGTRWLQAGLIAATVPVSYLVGREAFADRDHPAALLVPAFVATNSQLALFGSAGLETALWSLLLSVSLWRLLVEARTGGVPWSALGWWAVALTRPEGLLYAVVGGALSMGFHAHSGRGWRPTVAWLLVFGPPWLAAQALRVAYFAWPLPNGAYALLAPRVVRLGAWDRIPWTWQRSWAHEMGHGYLVLAYVFGAVGHGARWRGLVAGGAATALGGSWWLADHLPGWAPPAWLIVAAAALPWASAGAEGWRARMSCACFAVVGVGCAVVAEFDWMKGYRWYATIVVPGAVLLAAGLHSLWRTLTAWVPGRPAWGGPVGAGVVWAGMSWVHGAHTMRVDAQKDPSPRAVQVRVDYVMAVRDRLFFDDEPFVVLDVDVGPYLVGSDLEVIDFGRLVDVPLAHGAFARPFLREYLFEERRPHVAHMHGGWAANARVPTYPEWRRDYLEIPGFPVGGGHLHIGNYVRKDLMIGEASPFPRAMRRVAEGGVVFEGFRIPVNPAQARSMYVEVAVSTSAGRARDAGTFHLLMAVAGPGGTSSFDVPIGYGWWPPEDWPNLGVFHGKHALSLPDHLEPGTYDVAFVFLDADGRVLPFPARPDEPARAPLFAKGEARFDQALTIVTVEERAKSARSDREAAIAAADAGDCDEATERWTLARRRRPADPAWAERHRPVVNTARAGCRIREALSVHDRDEKVRLLARARTLDRHHPELEAACQPLADALQAEGMAALAKARSLQATSAARALPHWETAFRQLADVMRVDPSRSWSRRYAEEARAARLGLDRSPGPSMR